jgi:hypothetical protein
VNEVLRVAVLLLLACSAPSKPPASAKLDATKSDAAVVVATADASRSVATPVDAAPPKPRGFDWEQLRVDQERPPKPPGDGPCANGPPYPQGVSCYPGGRDPRKKKEVPPIAAKVWGAEGVDVGHSRVTVDVGVNKLVTKTWVGAIVDRDGQPISAWEHPELVMREKSTFIFAITGTDVRYGAHVIILQQPPPK